MVERKGVRSRLKIRKIAKKDRAGQARDPTYTKLLRVVREALTSGRPPPAG